MKRHFIAIAILIIAWPAAHGLAQQSPDLRQLARDAGMIFSGAAETIEHLAPAVRGDVGIVRVSFRISDALRGATPGALLTINEWDGPWSSGDRYRVGENLLLFLYPPSGRLGLTTTVGGERGRLRAADSGISIATVALAIGETPISPPAEPERTPIERPTRPLQLRVD